MRGLMRRGAVAAGAVAVLLGSGTGIAAASPPRPASGAPAWSITPTPSPSGSKFAQFLGVSCRSASACTAVGWYAGNDTPQEPLAERWNGKAWAVQAIPNPAGSTDTRLLGVSCTSASACIAVGSSFSGSEGPGDTVAERWNGTTWTIQPIPTPRGNNGDGDPEAVLNGVSCTSASACTTVGWYYNINIFQVTLAEHWNGTAWAIQHTPSLGGYSGDDQLGGVSCTSASACIAAGTAKGVTLAERYGRSS